MHRSLLTLLILFLFGHFHLRLTLHFVSDQQHQMTSVKWTTTDNYHQDIKQLKHQSVQQVVVLERIANMLTSQNSVVGQVVITRATETLKHRNIFTLCTQFYWLKSEQNITICMETLVQWNVDGGNFSISPIVEAFRKVWSPTWSPTCIHTSCYQYKDSIYTPGCGEA